MNFDEALAWLTEELTDPTPESATDPEDGKHPECVRCHRTNREHVARGLCGRCYYAIINRSGKRGLERYERRRKTIPLGDIATAVTRGLLDGLTFPEIAAQLGMRVQSLHTSASRARQAGLLLDTKILLAQRELMIREGEIHDRRDERTDDGDHTGGDDRAAEVVQHAGLA